MFQTAESISGNQIYQKAENQKSGYQEKEPSTPLRTAYAEFLDCAPNGQARNDGVIVPTTGKDTQ